MPSETSVQPPDLDPAYKLWNDHFVSDREQARVFYEEEGLQHPLFQLTAWLCIWALVWLLVRTFKCCRFGAHFSALSTAVASSTLKTHDKDTTKEEFALLINWDSRVLSMFHAAVSITGGESI